MKTLVAVVALAASASAWAQPPCTTPPPPGCPTTAVAANAARLCWVHDGRYEDGTPATLTGFKAYFGTNGLTSSQSISGGATRDALITNLSPGLYTFAVAALEGSTESDRSCTWTKLIVAPPLGNPTQAPTFTYTVAQPSSVTVTIGAINGVNQFNLAITGNGPVTIALLGSLVFDWCRPGPVGTPLTPTVPALGENGGAFSKSVTFTAPVTTYCDADPTTAFGGTVTVQGVTKPLVNASGVWSAVF